MKPPGRAHFPMLGILIAGTALRLFHLGAGSLWYDETVSVFLAGSPVPELVRHTAGDIHPPLYYLLLRGWLILTGYPTGHADAHGLGLEFSAALFSCLFGLLLIALSYRLTRWLLARQSGLPRRGTAWLAAALVSASPYNVWYSQEVRMYTLGAVLGVVAAAALWRATEPDPCPQDNARPIFWWAAYALAAAAGMYTLYYFAFLLVPLNVWACARLLQRRAGPAPEAARPARRAAACLAANAAAVILYVPWLANAWRQATQPPVPAWRAVTALGQALVESWTALALGQSSPSGAWLAIIVLVPVYLLGLWAVNRAHAVTGEPAAAGSTPPASRAPRAGGKPAVRWAALLASPAALLALATFGALALILLVSAVTPLYHVRYVFTYSPFFYIGLAGGLGWLWQHRRSGAVLVGAVWLAASAATLAQFWFDARYQADDHRAAVAYVQEHWRPGDVLLVNAGYAYTAIATYWQPTGSNPAIAWQGRLTGDLPEPRSDAGLVMLTTGHVDGPPGLGWGDPRSDFFAMPAGQAAGQIDRLLTRFARVWHYRIYDTVNDPQGRLRRVLADGGQLCFSQVFPGEAGLRVQGFVPRQGTAAQPGWWEARSGALAAQIQLADARVTSGATLYPSVQWQAIQPLTRTLATSLRLQAVDGSTWAQPADERPAGPLCPSERWPAGAWQPQTWALDVPPGTPPGSYTLQLVPYDAGTGQPWGAWTPQLAGGAGPATGLALGHVQVEAPNPPPALQPALARFGPLALLSAGTPATRVSPGDPLAVELKWQAVEAPGEPLVAVLQLLDSEGRVAANLEAQPVDGRYPVTAWSAHEIVRDQHVLATPADLPPGDYQLIVGVYRANGGERLRTPSGLFGGSDRYVIKEIALQPRTK